jgi:hypothetical protein
MTRDARPFLAHHLRECADARRDSNGEALHLLARWVENLPADNAAIRRIGATAALDYDNGGFVCGDASTALIDDYRNLGRPRRRWLVKFADAVESDLRVR